MAGDPTTSEQPTRRTESPASDEWYMVTGGGVSALRISAGFTVGESETGALALNDPEPANQWIEFVVSDSGDPWITIVTREKSLSVDGAIHMRHQVTVGAEVRLPNNSLYISHDIRMPRPAGLVLEVVSREVPGRAADLVGPGWAEALAAVRGSGRAPAPDDATVLEEDPDRTVVYRPEDQPPPEPAARAEAPAGYQADGLDDLSVTVAEPRSSRAFNRRRPRGGNRRSTTLLASLGVVALALAGVAAMLVSMRSPDRSELSDLELEQAVQGQPSLQGQRALQSDPTIDPAVDRTAGPATDPTADLPTDTLVDRPIDRSGELRPDATRPDGRMFEPTPSGAADDRTDAALAGTDEPGSRPLRPPVRAPLVGLEPAQPAAADEPAVSSRAAEGRADVAESPPVEPSVTDPEPATGRPEPADGDEQLALIPRDYARDEAPDRSDPEPSRDPPEAAAAEPARTPPAEVDAGPPDWRLVRAGELLEAGYITFPPHDNAVAYLERLLAVEPYNEQAMAMLDECTRRLVEAAVRAHDQGMEYEARNTLEEVLGFNPQNVRANQLWREWVGTEH